MRTTSCSSSGLERANHEGQAAGGVSSAGGDPVAVAGVPGLGDANVGGVVATGDEAKLDRRGFVVIAPVDEDPAVVFDLLDPDLRRGAVHLPFPSDSRTANKLAAALGKPEPGRDGGVDEGLEHIAGRPANQHPHLDRRGMRELEVAPRDALHRPAGARPRQSLLQHMQLSGCLTLIGRQGSCTPTAPHVLAIGVPFEDDFPHPEGTHRRN